MTTKTDNSSPAHGVHIYRVSTIRGYSVGCYAKRLTFARDRRSPIIPVARQNPPSPGFPLTFTPYTVRSIFTVRKVRYYYYYTPPSPAQPLRSRFRPPNLFIELPTRYANDRKQYLTVSCTTRNTLAVSRRIRPVFRFENVYRVRLIHPRTDTIIVRLAAVTSSITRRII